MLISRVWFLGFVTWLHRLSSPSSALFPRCRMNIVKTDINIHVCFIMENNFLFFPVCIKYSQPNFYSISHYFCKNKSSAPISLWKVVKFYKNLIHSILGLNTVQCVWKLRTRPIKPSLFSLFVLPYNQNLPSDWFLVFQTDFAGIIFIISIVWVPFVKGKEVTLAWNSYLISAHKELYREQ